MANYNNIYGYNYPYGAPYTPYSQQLQPNYNNVNNMMNNQNQQPQANNYFYVNGIIGAKSFQMQPNQTVMLMDSDSPMCYMKQTNSMGQATLRYFKLVEISEDDLKTPQAQGVQPNVEYALKSDLEALNKKLNEISSRFEKPLNSTESK